MRITKGEFIMDTTNLRTLRLENLQKITQGKRRTLDIPVDFSHIKEEFVGSFTVHYPSQMEKIQIGVIKSELLQGNMMIDTETDNTVSAIATLEVVLDKYPDWFNPYDPDVEYEILEHLLIEYLKWVRTFREEREARRRAKGDSTTI
jgi:hypothetical protein